jgi:hypothetical protein
MNQEDHFCYECSPTLKTTRTSFIEFAFLKKQCITCVNSQWVQLLCVCVCVGGGAGMEILMKLLNINIIHQRSVCGVL